MGSRTGTIAFVGWLCAAQAAIAQPPEGPGAGPGRGFSKQEDADDLVSRMLAFDANKDGYLIRSEVTDNRLLRLFDRADADKNGRVTKSELTALAEKEHADLRGGPGFGPPGGPGGFGPPGGPGFGGPPRPGEILPAMVQDRLRLTPEQKNQLAGLQKEVDARLEKILNDDQRKQLIQMRRRGPGGFGPPGGGGPGGFGPPGGRRRPAGPGGGPRPEGPGQAPDGERPSS